LSSITFTAATFSLCAAAVLAQIDQRPKVAATSLLSRVKHTRSTDLVMVVVVLSGGETQGVTKRNVCVRTK
jgi:hypothetical protein